MKLRNRLNRILYERGLAEGEVASVCRLDQGHFNRIKNGRVKPSLVTALRISNALGMSVNQLFFLDPNAPERSPGPPASAEKATVHRATREEGEGRARQGVG
jgi:transcriptional regulator with XRE-family HTH domain